MTRSAVYLDRDGVLTVLVCDDSTGTFESPLHPEGVELVPGAAEAARALARAGYLLVGVTNQPAAADRWSRSREAVRPRPSRALTATPRRRPRWSE